MPRIVRTARGEQVDFDTIIIKQQLAQAPMNIEVARRKEFIDSKEGKARGMKSPAGISVDGPADQRTFIAQDTTAAASDFEIESTPLPKSKAVEEPVPNIPEKK